MSIEIAGIGIVAAFLAGAISFLSPCVLPLVPGYVSFIAGQTDHGDCHHDRATYSVRLLAARDVPGSWENRLGKAGSLPGCAEKGVPYLQNIDTHNLA